MLKDIKRQAGFTAIEALVVLIVTVSAIGVSTGWVADYADSLAFQSAAAHKTKIADAAAKYIEDNNATLLATATATTPVVITVPMLKATTPPYLPASISNTNGYQQSYEIRVLKTATNTLETLLVTTGGEAIPENGIRRIAQLTAGRGGYISSQSPTRAVGAYRQWDIALADYGTNPGAGHLAAALFFQDGTLVADFLYRNSVSGHPEYNRMNTAIDMNSNNINNAATVNATP
jgi:Tfp pilus assembly protein PilE